MVYEQICHDITASCLTYRRHKNWLLDGIAGSHEAEFFKIQFQPSVARKGWPLLTCYYIPSQGFHHLISNEAATKGPIKPEHRC